MSQPILTHSYYSDFFAAKGYDFLKQIADQFVIPDNLVIFSVMHCYEGSLPYINVLAEIADKLVFIPKSATALCNQDITTTIEQLPRCHVVNKEGQQYGKEQLKDPAIAEHLIRAHLKADSQFLILDHGGYFAHAIEHISTTFQEQCLGITELTANGLYKYLNRQLDKPLVTVSHLSIKAPADYEASECIVHYSDQILREEFGLKLNNDEFLKIGVIGAGNLGQGVIKYLKGKAISQILVADTDPRRLTHFPRNGVQVSSIERLINECNMIFCCTGNGALPSKLLDNLNDSLFISTVTSADDELNLPQLIADGTLTEVGGNRLIREYHTRRGQSLYLLAGGESANTPFKTGMGDPTLYLFEAAHMLAGLQLATEARPFKQGIQALNEEDEKRIAEQWLRHFYRYE
ncbi:NAD(P)-binding domain-containing protein [uncultured Photobacterium sp.]|uniref:NAD(P)-binding domain-containing protein n=1 Tax=uncultured Photobacterium sp. TaxID=173973 RepID=UPI0026331F5C|nr:NAD(P)-binding domain-containing protein [uncultured Photobacterium sp.]